MDYPSALPGVCMVIPYDYMRPVLGTKTLANV
jgi:hypothetical protein